MQEVCWRYGFFFFARFRAKNISALPEARLNSKHMEVTHG